MDTSQWCAILGTSSLISLPPFTQAKHCTWSWMMKEGTDSPALHFLRFLHLGPRGDLEKLFERSVGLSEYTAHSKELWIRLSLNFSWTMLLLKNDTQYFGIWGQCQRLRNSSNRSEERIQSCLLAEAKCGKCNLALKIRYSSSAVVILSSSRWSLCASYRPDFQWAKCIIRIIWV